MALQARYGHGGDSIVLDEALDLLRRAVALTPSNHPRRMTQLINLACVLLIRFEKNADTAMLHEATAVARASLSHAEHGSLHHGRAQMLLCNTLLMHYYHGGDATALNEAIVLGRQVLATKPIQRSVRASLLNFLSSGLLELYDRDGDPATLEEAISASREATNTANNDLTRAMTLNGLGAALQTRYEHGGRTEALNEALDAFRHAAGVGFSPPYLRFMSARGWGTCAALVEDWEQACAAYSVAIAQVFQLAPRRLVRGDREHRLAYVDRLASDAAACALQTGDIVTAVRWLEEGRSVISSQILDSHGDTAVLRELAPELADRFDQLRDELDDSDVELTIGSYAAGSTGDTTRLIEHRRHRVQQWDELIDLIRRQPGLESFLRPPEIDELLAVANQGPVIIINVSPYRCDAIILTSARMIAVPLPKLTSQAVLKHVSDFIAALDRLNKAKLVAHEQSQRDIHTVLAWLWDTIAEPVLTGLGIDSEPNEGNRWPRLWWVPTGLLSFLPLHAAGHHDGGSQTVMDRVISSYTPTVRALRHARRTASTERPESAPAQLLVVAMEHTPGGLSHLPGAKKEVQILRRRFSDITLLLNGNATRRAAMDALPAHRWTHFACHGEPDPTIPSNSRLLLSDHQKCPLTVVDIARLRLREAELVFLSACSTAAASRNLTDEAIHVASAFQLAGYRHVIATLWPIHDAFAVRIATDFYDALLANPDDFAAALHNATQLARANHPNLPSVWAAHLHSGG